MPAESSSYPWFGVVRGHVLEQGDLLRGCPRFVLPPDAARSEANILLTRETVDAVILSQSCDLALRADGECEASDVLLGFVYLKNDLASHPVFGKEESWEEVRKGRRPFFHVLNECSIPGHEQDFVLVDFHALFTLSVPLVREFAEHSGNRLRLLPPYREHLSQAFARLFMRVGLPTDVPPFGRKK
jgi:hypothetical protein